MITSNKHVVGLRPAGPRGFQSPFHRPTIARNEGRGLRGRTVRAHLCVHRNVLSVSSNRLCCSATSADFGSAYNFKGDAEPGQDEKIQSIAKGAVVPTVIYKITIYLQEPAFDLRLQLNLEQLNLRFKVYDQKTQQHSILFNVDKQWEERKWDRPNELSGIVRIGEIQLPASFTPGALQLESLTNSRAGPGYVSQIKMMPPSGPEIVFAAHSHIYPQQGQRVFFAVTTLPSATPIGLEALRNQELLDLQCLTNTDSARKPYDRIYQYDTYNDLAPEGERPVLGNAEYPYPRRLKGGSVGKPYVPKDDDFDLDKTVGFLGNAVVGQLPKLAFQFNPKLVAFNLFFPEDSPQRTLFLDIRQAFRDFTLSVASPQVQSFLANIFFPDQLYTLKQVDDLYKPEEAPEAPADEKVVKSRKQKGGSEASVLLDLTKYDKPREYDPSPEILPLDPGSRTSSTWRTDEDWGRQYIAGLNPMVLAVLTKEALDASTIEEKHLTPHLGGLRLSELLATSSSQPRLFAVDYWDALMGYTAKVNEEYAKQGRVLHAGRAVLFRRDDGHMVPIAIELGTCSDRVGVYTPASGASVWEVAKAIFQTLDSGVHQLYSHFVRTHACTEPYYIAMCCQLSAMHPVYRLMHPHFRYTLKINANARSSLIQKNGIIESNFTPGRFCMELSAKLYGAAWRFDLQGLPYDLKSRGFLDANGKLLLEDYPYAQDGLLIWAALESYFSKYLALYYASDEQVQKDKELQGWWSEVQGEGHPDIKIGWPTLNSLSDLVSILTTIAWVASGHHAAVNFGQYDFSAYMPNHSSNCSKAMPLPGSAEFKRLASLSTASPEYEAELLSYLANKLSAMTVMSTVKLLAAHAEDENYLSSGRPEWITDPAAVKIFEEFVAEIRGVEAKINAANKDPRFKARSTFPGGYTLLIPSSGPGVTGRGVPYSISI